MKKIYEKPEVTEVTLISEEVITSDDLIDGEMGLESSIF